MSGAPRRPAMWIPDGSPYALDAELYDRIADTAGRTPASAFEVNIGQGKAWRCRRARCAASWSAPVPRWAT